ncbi:hypothetical protein JCM8097_006599 [Rhodosporidiobolus ruineniae]
MLLALPPELVEHILSLISPTDLPLRRRTLFACCLVAKALSAVAQPILWQRVELVAVNGVEDLPSGAVVEKGLVGQTKALALRASGDVTAVVKLATELFIGVEDLAVSLGRTGNLALGEEAVDLGRLSKLRRLTFCDGRLTVLSPPSLPSLRIFCLQWVTVQPGALESILTTATLPSLRAFSGNDLQREGSRPFAGLPQFTIPAPFFPVLPPDFIDQLDLIQVRIDNAPQISQLPPEVDLSGTPILYTIPHWASEASQVIIGGRHVLMRHVSLVHVGIGLVERSPDPPSTRDVRTAFDKILTRLDDRFQQVPLETLWIPNDIPTSLAEPRQVLLDACKRHKVEVELAGSVVEGIEDAGASWSMVHEGVLEYYAKLKRRSRSADEP